jgi:hypothetical protein
MITGGTGSAIANPTDLVKLRIQGEAGALEGGVYTTGLKVGAPRSYNNSVHGIVEIARTEGLRGLYQGTQLGVCVCVCVCVCDQGTHLY